VVRCSSAPGCAGRGRNGGNGGRGGRGRSGGGGGRWARHRAALAAAAAAEPPPPPPDSPDERAAARAGRPAGRARAPANHRLAEPAAAPGPPAGYSTRSLRNGGALTASGPLAFASLMGALGALEKRHAGACFGAYNGAFGPAAGALAAELAAAMAGDPRRAGAGRAPQGAAWLFEGHARILAASERALGGASPAARALAAAAEPLRPPAPPLPLFL